MFTKFCDCKNYSYPSFSLNFTQCAWAYSIQWLLGVIILQIVAIATAALDEYRAEAKKMVVALVDMERAFIPPQHFIRLVQRR